MQQNMIEQNIIITEPNRNLRALGRNALRNNWRAAIMAVCTYVLVLNIPPVVFNGLFGTNIISIFTNSGYTYGFDAETYASIYNNMPDYCFLGTVYVLLVTGALELGLSMYFLAVFRMHKVHVADVFLGFEHYLKALGLFFFMNLFIFLWTLLFIVPGIISSIRYSQAFFILADDPSKGIRQCMNESKMMMKGNCSKYFLLSLSFIGWLLLSMIPASIVESIGSTVSNNEVIVSLFAIAGTLFVVPVTVYMFSTYTGFYEILAGHLIKETVPVPVTVEEAKEVYAGLIAQENQDETAEINGETEESAGDEIAETSDNSSEQDTEDSENTTEDITADTSEETKNE
ncbi:MAG: DUF975 family protein [Lentihominibacter sp.]